MARAFNAIVCKSLEVVGSIGVDHSGLKWQENSSDAIGYRGVESRYIVHRKARIQAAAHYPASSPSHGLSSRLYCKKVVLLPKNHAPLTY